MSKESEGLFGKSVGRSHCQVAAEASRDAGDRWSVDVRLGLRAGALRHESGSAQSFGLRATLVGWTVGAVRVVLPPPLS